MKNNTNWNWKIFLLCPVWIIANRYTGSWVFFLPAMLSGALSMLMKVPLLTNIAGGLLFMINILWVLFYMAILSPICFVANLVKIDICNNFIAVFFPVIIYHLICCVFISLIIVTKLQQNKSHREISSVKISYKKWNAIELLMVIPVALLMSIISCINTMVVMMSMPMP
jgi:hypothetical protein